MIEEPPIVVPAPTFREPGHALDRETTVRYAGYLGSVPWTKHILVNGPMGHGEVSTPSERALVLDMWLECVPSERLIAACWDPADVRAAQARRVRPLVMLSADTDVQLAQQLHEAPVNAWVYANPRYSRVLLSGELATASRVAGVKLSKVSTEDLATMRAACPDATIVHGSSRNIAASLDAGADLVTAAPLAATPATSLDLDLSVIQRHVDTIQASLDKQDGHDARVRWVAQRGTNEAHEASQQALGF